MTGKKFEKIKDECLESIKEEKDIEVLRETARQLAEQLYKTDVQAQQLHNELKKIKEVEE